MAFASPSTSEVFHAGASTFEAAGCSQVANVGASARTSRLCHAAMSPVTHGYSFRKSPQALGSTKWAMAKPSAVGAATDS